MFGTRPVKAAPFLCFKLFSIERPKLLGMAPNVGKHALTFLYSPFSFCVQRTKVWPDSAHALKNGRPATLDRRQGHKQRLSHRRIIHTFQGQLQQFLFSPCESELRGV